MLDVIEFEVEYDFARANPWRDAYVNANMASWLSITGGRFKMPFGREATTPMTKLPFVFRSDASSRIAPGRDAGVMAHGRPAGRMLEYAAGVFRGEGENARSLPPPLAAGHPRRELTGAGEVTVRPFHERKNLLRKLDLGVAATIGQVEEGLSPPAETESGHEIFPSVFIRGLRRRSGLQAAWSGGPGWIQWEYLRASDERQRQGLGDVNLPPLVASGWYSSAGLKAGPLEGAVRYAALSLRSGAVTGAWPHHPRAPDLPRSETGAWTVGATARLNRWMRLQVNVVRETLSDLERIPDEGPRVFWTAVCRTQAAI
jgi:phosphate-selective porin